MQLWLFGRELANGDVYVTLIGGLYRVAGQQLMRLHEIPNPQNRCIRDPAGERTLFVLNGSVVAVDDSGKFFVLTPRYPGHVRLFADAGEVCLHSNGNDMSQPVARPKLVHDLGGARTEQVIDYRVSHSVDACVIDDERYAVNGSLGLAVFENHTEQWSLQATNGTVVNHHRGTLYFVERGTHLQAVGLNGTGRRSLATFTHPSTSIGDFAILDDAEYLLHIRYRRERVAQTCLARLKMRAP